MIHDVAIAIRRLQFEGAIERAMVVDTDVHQGNGTAAIFAEDCERFHAFDSSGAQLSAPEAAFDRGYQFGGRNRR